MEWSESQKELTCLPLGLQTVFIPFLLKRLACLCVHSGPLIQTSQAGISGHESWDHWLLLFSCHVRPFAFCLQVLHWTFTGVFYLVFFLWLFLTIAHFSSAVLWLLWFQYSRPHHLIGLFSTVSNFLHIFYKFSTWVLCCHLNFNITSCHFAKCMLLNLKLWSSGWLFPVTLLVTKPCGFVSLSSSFSLPDWVVPRSPLCDEWEPVSPSAASPQGSPISLSWFLQAMSGSPCLLPAWATLNPPDLFLWSPTARSASNFHTIVFSRRRFHYFAAHLWQYILFTGFPAAL